MTLPLSPSFMDIPHIVDAIFNFLPFADLYNCIFVSHCWHDALIARLWQDAVNFRPVPMEGLFNMSTYTYNFLTPDSHNALYKHAHYIRALTLRGDALIPVLVAAGVTNLVELNFIIGERITLPNGPSSVSIQSPNKRRRPNPDLYLGELNMLIAANPSICSLSIENIDVHSKAEFLALEKFVKSLDASPSITCLHLSGWFSHMDNEEEYTSFLIAVMERRLALVDKNKIRTLKLQSKTHFTRSKRGLPGQEGAAKHQWAGGRWENERLNPYQRVIAVLENNGVLEIGMPQEFFSGLIFTLLTRFPALQQLDLRSFWDIDPQILHTLPTSCPDLHSFVLPWTGIPTQDVARFLRDPRIHLSSLTLYGIEQLTYTIALRPLLLQSTPHFLRHALVRASFLQNSLSMSFLLEILAACSNLQTLLASEVKIDGSEPEISPVWASQQLQVLHLQIILKGSYYTFHDNVMEDIVRAERSASRLESTFMHQLGLQKHLRELHLVDTHQRFTESIFLKLSLENPHGVQRLAELAQLETVMLSGDTQSIGVAEVEWMAEHWPRLKLIQLYSNKPIIPRKNIAFEEMASLYTPWYPRLRMTNVFIPGSYEQ